MGALQGNTCMLSELSAPLPSSFHRPSLSTSAFLSGFAVCGVLLAEAAILLQLKTIGIVLAVFHGIIIALLAVAAR